MRKIFNSKSPPKGRACADSHRDFWTWWLASSEDSYNCILRAWPDYFACRAVSLLLPCFQFCIHVGGGGGGGGGGHSTL